MKKLMFAALAVAGMSAVAAEGFNPDAAVAVEKIQLTLKAVNTNALASVKLNGFVFTDTNQFQKAYVWSKAEADMTGQDHEWLVTNKAQKVKKISLKKVSKLENLGAYNAEIFLGQKKSGKSVNFDKGYVGYGSGSVSAWADLVKGNLKAKESVSGNIVNQAERKYGTWKLSFDKADTKLLSEGWTVKDILGKAKVEFWDL